MTERTWVDVWIDACRVRSASPDQAKLEERDRVLVRAQARTHPLNTDKIRHRDRVLARLNSRGREYEDELTDNPPVEWRKVRGVWRAVPTREN